MQLGILELAKLACEQKQDRNEPIMPSVSERIVLKDVTCPLIRLDKTRRKDKSISFSLALFLHILIFGLVGFSFVKSPQFGIDQGLGGVEINLVASADEVPVVQPPEPPLVHESDIIEKVIVPSTVTKKESQEKVDGKDLVNAQSTRGAIFEAKPDYLKNPAPEYPESARRRGYQGIVFLLVGIDQHGSVKHVKVKESSGHALLDQAAVKAVRTWKFHPGKVGILHIESSVQVPIRFNLERSEKF